MGYRLCIERVGKDSPVYYGTKLYGYEDETVLESYQWLMSKGFLDENHEYTWGYGCDNPILMRVRDFRIFAMLYNFDFNHFLDKSMKDYFIKDEVIQEFLHLDDSDFVVISWC